MQSQSAESLLDQGSSLSQAGKSVAATFHRRRGEHLDIFDIAFGVGGVRGNRDSRRKKCKSQNYGAFVHTILKSYAAPEMLSNRPADLRI